MDLAFQLLKNCIPTDDGVPWLVKSRIDAKKVQSFSIDMGDSKQFTDPSPKKPAPENTTTDGAKAAKGKGGKSSGKAARKARADNLERFARFCGSRFCGSPDRRANRSHSHLKGCLQFGCGSAVARKECALRHCSSRCEPRSSRAVRMRFQSAVHFAVLRLQRWAFWASKAAVSPNKPQETFEKVSCNASSEWATTLADDIRNAFEFVLENVQPNCVSKEVVSSALQLAIEFVFNGHINVVPINDGSREGKEATQTTSLNTWTRVRKHICKFIAFEHRNFMSDEAKPTFHADPEDVEE